MVGQITKKIFGLSNNIGRINAGSALLYLIRRFGYTTHGGDADKEVCFYSIPTGVPDFFVGVRIGGVSAYIRAEGYRDLLFDNDEAMSPYYAAYSDTLLDLLRPVLVRDVAINILGRADDMVINEESLAEPSPTAGWGVPQAWLDNPCRTLEILGE